MVNLQTKPSSHSQTCPSQIKNATVVLDEAGNQTLLDGFENDIDSYGGQPYVLPGVDGNDLLVNGPVLNVLAHGSATDGNDLANAPPTYQNADKQQVPNLDFATYSVEQVAATIRNMPCYFSGETVQLWACYTGTNGFAEKLASILGANVIVPTGYISSWDDGAYAITPNETISFADTGKAGPVPGATPANMGWVKVTPTTVF